MITLKEFKETLLVSSDRADEVWLLSAFSSARVCFYVPQCCGAVVCRRNSGAQNPQRLTWQLFSPATKSSPRRYPRRKRRSYRTARTPAASLRPWKYHARPFLSSGCEADEPPTRCEIDGNLARLEFLYNRLTPAPFPSGQGHPGSKKRPGKRPTPSGVARRAQALRHLLLPLLFIAVQVWSSMGCLSTVHASIWLPISGGINIKGGVTGLGRDFGNRNRDLQVQEPPVRPVSIPWMPLTPRSGACRSLLGVSLGRAIHSRMFWL